MSQFSARFWFCKGYIELFVHILHLDINDSDQFFNTDLESKFRPKTESWKWNGKICAKLYSVTASMDSQSAKMESYILYFQKKKWFPNLYNSYTWPTIFHYEYGKYA